MEQFKQVLAAAGLPQEQIEALSVLTPEQLKEFKPDEYATALGSSYRNRFLNDSEFLSSISLEKIPESIKKTLEGNQYGRFMNETRTYAEKELGLDLSDMTQEQGKGLKSVLAFIMQKNTAKMSNPDAVKELQSQLQKTLQELDQTKTTATERETAIRLEESSKYMGRFQNYATLQELSTIEDLAIDPNAVSEIVFKMVEAKYTPVLNPDTLEFKLMRKDNPALDAIDKAGKPITFRQAALEVMTGKKGFLTEKKADDPNPEPGKVTKVVVGKDGQPTHISSHIRKLAGLE